MSELQRPNPDALLAAINEEAARKERGELKVFLGMCPGVGKTYAMLEAAQQELKAGREVVVGYVETHGRKETDALARGFETVPRQEVEYRGVAITEMDLDAILARRPRLVLVDELAHTNAPGARHPKRWQDVQELVEEGIHVFTTLNVQHVESRADTVRQITGAEIRETVPDSVLDRAVLEVGRPATPRAGRATAAGKSVRARSRCDGSPEFFPRSEPDGVAGAGITPGRGPRRRRHD